MTFAGNTASPDAAVDARILIVEDERFAREASERYLDCCGYRVATAASAEEAFREAAANTPDVVVCDWRLDGRPDGVDVARELQCRYGSALVFVTAYPLDELRAATGDLDVARYLRKPFSLAALADALRTI